MKRLVLIGGGHAHVHVLKSLAEQPLADVAVTLISPYSRQVYSGMLPGWIAGHYDIEQCIIPLPPLAKQAKVVFCQGAVRHINFAAESVIYEGENGKQNTLPFDWLSIDIGPMPSVSGIPGAAEYALSVRPIEHFIQSFTAIKSAVLTSMKTGKARRLRIVFIGGGAAAVELALAMQHALAAADLSITLVSAANTLPDQVEGRIKRVLRRRGIVLLVGQSVARVERGTVYLASGGIIEADFVIAATGAAAAPWPGASGLKTDERGFILVDDNLRSVSHANVFAAGDCAANVVHTRPKSGVYAVRAGPPLARNLRHALTGTPLVPYIPQQHSLYLISTGNRYAIGSWGEWSWQGYWVWWWKNWLDTSFMKRYTVSQPR